MAKHIQYEIEQDDTEKPKNLEDVLESIGGFGRFQFLSLLFILFYEIPVGMLGFANIFVGGTPKEWYCSEDNATTAMNYTEICECKGTRFSNESTIVSEWDLICDKSWGVDIITSVQMLGMLVGNTVPPLISDWYGRKRTFIGLISTMILGQGLSAVSINPYMFAVSRFICGIGHAGYMTINGIYSMEFLTPKWRQLAGCLGPLGEGIMLLSVLAYFIRPWRLLILTIAAPFLTILPIAFFLPESPRWLLKQKRIAEAEKVIRYIAKVNRKPVEKMDQILKQVAAQEEKSVSVVRFSYLDLFRRDEFRIKTIVFMGIWFFWALQYYGIKFNVKNFDVSPYLMLLLLGLVDSIGFRCALLINNRLGRRTALVTFSSVACFFFSSLAVMQLFVGQDKQKTTFIVLVLLGKLGVAGGRSAMRCATVESYPVSIRTMGFGMARMASAFGGVVAPQLAYAGTKWPVLPLFTFAVVAMMGSLVSLRLSETSGKPLQDDVKEAVVEQTNVEKGASKRKHKVVPLDMYRKETAITYAQVVNTVDGMLANKDKICKEECSLRLKMRSKSF